MSYGQNNTSTMANYFEDTGFGDPLAANNGLAMQWQFFQGQNGALGSVEFYRRLSKVRAKTGLVESGLTLFNGQRAHILNIVQQAYISDYDVASDQYDPVISVIPYGTVLDVEAVASADRKYIHLLFSQRMQGWIFRQFVIEGLVC